jgi:glycosyltransferase involved in cell wall biosynthesis
MAKTIKKVLNDKHTIFIYTTQELILNIENNDIDIKVIDLFVLLNSYDVNIILNKKTLVSLLPIEKIVHWICDYSSWINHENKESMDNGRKMLLDTLNHSKITLLSCDKIKKYLDNLKIYPQYMFDFEYLTNLEIFKYYDYTNNDIFLKKKLIIGWAGNASPHCHGWLKGLDNIKNVINKNSDKFELVYHNKFEGNDISYEDMPLFYKNIDIYVCFSKYEGSPNTILEASACGRAWISTNVGNIEKMINLNNKSGIMIERSEEDLEKALLNLYYNRNLIIELGINAKDNIEKNFNYINIVNNTFNNIFNVLKY